MPANHAALTMVLTLWRQRGVMAIAIAIARTMQKLELGTGRR
ncbi:hypothetical protein FHT03_002399 [Xanthomonas arboricola]|nr:hypothetical protein [Xanthomonas cannabis]MBB3805670.1 hypothetical protein [Xanthomonas cannabis]